MGDHAVERAHRGAVDVPRPEQGLERLHERVAAVAPERLGELVRLDDRRHVGEEDTPRPQHARHRLHQAPGLRQIEHRPIHHLLLGQPLLHRADAHDQVGHLAEPHVDVGERAAAEVLALLVAHHAALGPDRAQEGQREGARAHPGLEHARAREDVGPEHHHRQVLGIDDLGPARHVEHVLGQGRAQGQVARALGGADPGPVGVADDGVVGHPAAIGVEGLALPEEQQMAPAPLVDQQGLLAVLEPIRRHRSWDPAGRARPRSRPGASRPRCRARW